MLRRTILAIAATASFTAIALGEPRQRSQFTGSEHLSGNDIFIVQDGAATVLYGGQLQGGRQTGPGETLGGEIVNGERRRIGYSSSIRASRSRT
jgi:hypothetical protein